MLKTKYRQDIVTDSGKQYSRIVTLPRTLPIYNTEHLLLPLDAFKGTVVIKRVRYAVRYCLDERCWRVVGLYDGYYRDAIKHTISKELRQQILEKDNYTCQHCGTKDNLTIDHKQPILHGGETEIDNLQVLCQSCNSRKGARDSIHEIQPIDLNQPRIQLLPNVKMLDDIQLPIVELHESHNYNRVYIVAGLVMISQSYRKTDTPRPVRIVTAKASI